MIARSHCDETLPKSMEQTIGQPPEFSFESEATGDNLTDVYQTKALIVSIDLCDLNPCVSLDIN